MFVVTILLNVPFIGKIYHITLIKSKYIFPVCFIHTNVAFGEYSPYQSNSWFIPNALTISKSQLQQIHEKDPTQKNERFTDQRSLFDRERCACDRSVILYLVEDPQQLKQIRIERSRLQHPPPSRRPLRAGGPALVPAGV